jgi:sn-glycerol 3-phosphate transport system substrate-binding protein
MSFHRKFAALAVAIAIGGFTGPAAAQTEIQWWHAHGGALGERVNEIADNFNRSQSAYKLVATFKGNYSETMTAGIAAFRAGKPPHILQVFEVGTATMMGAKGAIKPIHELMQETGQAFDPSNYLSAVTGYYTTTDGKMLSMPFNSSTPVFWYNKDAFKKAGLDADNPPKTWPEVADAARKLIAAG